MARKRFRHTERYGWRRSGTSTEAFARQRESVAQRLRWWKSKLVCAEKALAMRAPAVLPVRVTPETSRRGEPVTVLLRTGHMLKVSHGFDEEAFARVVALLEGG